MSGSNALAASQQALLACLFEQPWNPRTFIDRHAWESGERGLQAYQANAHLLAERALRGAYPVIDQLLGPESFGALARALWHDHPPSSGDVAQWGGALASYIAASPQLAQEPYLSDVAASEWALHCVTTAQDGKPDLHSLLRLTQQDPAQLYLALAPGTQVIASHWPVVSILWAHGAGRDASTQADEGEDWPSLRQAGERIQAQVAETALVWRRGFKPCLRPTLAGETDFLAALQQGRPLGQAMALAPALDFRAWLAVAVSSGLLLSVTDQQPVPEDTRPTS